MTSLDRFRERNKQRAVAQDKLNKKFIFNGYPSITIEGAGDVSVQAAVVNQQEKDKAYIFTSLEDTLNIGSVWTAKNLPLLVTEQITIIKDVQWNKYVALLCNLKVEDTWGYFKGPEKSYINIALEEESAWDSRQKPVLVLPKNILGFEDKIVIKGRAWLVQEYDAISNDGVIYYSLTASTVSKQIADQHIGEDVYIEHKSTDTAITIVDQPVSTFMDDEIRVGANINITLPTENGYFKPSNSNINIKKRNATEVIFSIPFGISEVTVETKEKGDIVSKTYRVV